MEYSPSNFDLPDNGIFGGEKDETEQQFLIEPYVFTEEIAIAVDVAFATNRPLLIAGKPGCGKSRLAEAIASLKGWHFIGKTMTSRTRLDDLTVEMDHLRRLHDAHSNNNSNQPMKPDWAYHKPGIFWWALNHGSAQRRGAAENVVTIEEVPSLAFPGTFRQQAKGKHHTVLLIDEIDKAEPDLPNDLLEPLDRRSFDLPDGKKINEAENTQLLTLITTNGERQLPPAFLRRCVGLRLEEPNKLKLMQIAERHFPKKDHTLVQSIVDEFHRCREECDAKSQRAPGTSELIDAIRACLDLNIKANKEDPVWRQIQNTLFIKQLEK